MPAGLATIRDRSFRGDPDRKLAWLLLAATVPAAVAGFLLNDIFEQAVRAPGVVAFTLVVGGVVLWLADRLGATTKRVDDVTFPVAFALGVAQALALIPGISRSGITISAARLAGLDRASAARFSFLMATPITAGAALFEARKLAAGESGVDVSLAPLLVGHGGGILLGHARHPGPAELPAHATRSTSSSSTGSRSRRLVAVLIATGIGPRSAPWRS